MVKKEFECSKLIQKQRLKMPETIVVIPATTCATCVISLISFFSCSLMHELTNLANKNVARDTTKIQLLLESLQEAVLHLAK